ncbi:type 2 GTP cyclohydrolase I [Dickeya solani]|uniref:Type 2 GTP cyclohydrolase I n=1 Tax=Dickeya solani TaxID=1089444 RepID=A0ABU4ED08_9GAMM|nr:type 2 GTP cyclohydrolase I [Dickeya solani]MCA6997973.1 type 2 GTP cyclohydrolase I [Dickeya solani]MCZ0822426.1 type 2 GTP cyclohydrolase I [Dickeya solani]MDV6993632.1 type 2 GTP cyclohydrolase I [Dickeya solani]MDV7003290.1 type 2 GTP cyclohydrolase I [Dickeya solani]MDV7036481.1 type 2 GTP cyclohydrolase I [Dickeya solani]
MRNTELESLINGFLNVAAFQDYGPNGLQVEGRSEVRRIVTGVTACQALLDAAVAQQADAVLVHHGYFWRNEPAVVRGMKRQRLKTLLANDLNLYGYHLPLDAHPDVGNNARLAAMLDIRVQGEIESLLPYGELAQPCSGDDLRRKLEAVLERPVLHSGDNAPAQIRRLAWCTGGGQSFIDQAADFGVDAFITGEVSEKTIHTAREMGLHFYAAGHHATERAGIRALGEWLASQHGFEVTFIDIPNPA